jgi:hypothetical protein
MHRLEGQPGRLRHHRHEARADQRRGEQRTDEQAADAGRGLALEDERGAQAHHAQLRRRRLDGVQGVLGGRLVAGVERRADTLARPVLAHAAVLGPRRVDADGGRVHERARPGPRGGLEHPARAGDVDLLQRGLVAGGLDGPCEVDDRRRAAEELLERGGGHVGPHPGRARVAPAGEAAGDAHDLGHTRVARQRLQQARADVAGRARHHDAHGRWLPGRPPGPNPRSHGAAAPPFRAPDPG